MIGIYAGNYSEDEFLNFVNKTKYIWVSVSIILTYLFLHYYGDLAVWRFIPCLCIIMSILSVVSVMKNIDIERAASYSFGIYIMHWPVMLAARVFLYQILKIDTVICVIVMVLLGWFIPVLIIEFLRHILPQKFIKPFHYLLGV